MPQRPRAARSDGGFTLVELQVVLVVLGVLSAVAFHAVREAGGRDLMAVCRAETANVALASAAYHADTGGFATAIDDPAHAATTLVGAGYLRNAPGHDGYTITYDPADGTVRGGAPARDPPWCMLRPARGPREEAAMAARRTVRRGGAIALSAAFVAACGGTDTAAPAVSDDEDYVYCVRQEENAEDAEVVPPDQCENYVHHGGYYPYFYYILRGRSHSGHGTGTKVKVADARSRAAANDPAARKAVGLPERGAVPHGASRSGGFGGTAARTGGGAGTRGGTSGGFGGSGGAKGGGGSS